jgi:F-type H+-transporting ATPase subunit delta
VTNRTAATRYARALLDVALKEQADLAAIEAQLGQLATLFEQNDALRKAMLSPAVPVARKRAAVMEIASAAGVLPVLGKTIGLLAERDRLVILGDVAEAFRQRLMDRRNVVRAVVTTSEAISSDRLASIRQSLATATGRTVDIKAKVDPSILGGMVARVGGTVFDASVTSHLQRIRQRLDAGI